MNREYVVDGNVFGYYDEDDGHFVVLEEYEISDAQSDRYAVEVQNGDGYYSSSGRFVRFADDY